MEHADRLLSSPPKKRSNSTMVTPDQSVTTSSTSTPTVSVRTGNINYSQAVQAHTTQIRSVNIQPRGGMTMTTMTQTSQLVSAVMESRFQTIEQEQQDIKHRLHSVEHRTTTTDENIRLMMAHWQITPASIKRKLPASFEDSTDGNVGEASLPMLTDDQGQGTTHF